MNYEQSLEEFEQIASHTEGKNGNSYKSSNGYEFVIWIDVDEEHPEPESDLIQFEADYEDTTFDGMYKFTMMLPVPSDTDIVEQWLQQPSPPAEDLTEDDVLFAYLASEVLQFYRQNSKWTPFKLDHCSGLGFHAMDTGWEQALKDVQRGIAVLNGYLLWRNPRTAIYNSPRGHEDSVQDRLFGAGYLATTEQHCIYSLIPANDLITLGQAAVILYGENSQSKRVMLKQDVLYGDFQVFIDREENNPQKNQRLSHRDVVRVKATRIG